SIFYICLHQPLTSGKGRNVHIYSLISLRIMKVFCRQDPKGFKNGTRLTLSPLHRLSSSFADLPTYSPHDPLQFFGTHWAGRTWTVLEFLRFFESGINMRNDQR